MNVVPVLHPADAAAGGDRGPSMPAIDGLMVEAIDAIEACERSASERYDASKMALEAAKRSGDDDRIRAAFGEAVQAADCLSAMRERLVAARECRSELLRRDIEQRAMLAAAHARLREVIQAQNRRAEIATAVAMRSASMSARTPVVRTDAGRRDARPHGRRAGSASAKSPDGSDPEPPPARGRPRPASGVEALAAPNTTDREAVGS